MSSEREDAMREEMTERDLKERIALIETMIAEGRRSMERWGWVFVLWGVAYYVAIAWANWGTGLVVFGSRAAIASGVHSELAWPVTMFAGAALTLAIGLRRGREKTATMLGRAVTSVWIGIGLSMLVVFPALGFSGRMDEHSFVALVTAMLGAANAGSGLILRWRMQLACAVVWWAASVAACVGTVAQATVVFLAAVFLCQIVFGVYAMVRESRRARQGGMAHA
ncbi:MAG TPA: hypothetical protein VGR64_06420 [Terracidiphilus sp.]|nr:hypothetical protein [Terracidiphilus sp.]